MLIFQVLKRVQAKRKNNLKPDSTGINIRKQTHFHQLPQYQNQQPKLLALTGISIPTLARMERRPQFLKLTGRRRWKKLRTKANKFHQLIRKISMITLRKLLLNQLQLNYQASFLLQDKLHHKKINHSKNGRSFMNKIKLRKLQPSNQ